MNFATKCSAATGGDANRAARWPTLRFITNGFAADPAMILARTSLRSALHATPPSMVGDNKAVGHPSVTDQRSRIPAMDLAELIMIPTGLLVSLKRVLPPRI